MYPFLLAHESVKVIKFVCWGVRCFQGKAALGCADIGHTCESSRTRDVSFCNDCGPSPCAGLFSGSDYDGHSATR
jgi:hypothetical protein